LAATTWVHGRPVAADLRGKVVVVDVFTVDCINCKNVTPNLRSIHDHSRRNVAVIGIHTPETPYERNREHVLASLRDLGVSWPVAIDNESALWNAYGIQAWPTQLIFDRHGRLRQTIVGDSQDDVVDATIHRLLAEQR
jgi:thiol-disulfide isomerase/thioredoxin